MEQPSKQFYEFGPFRLDVVERLLLKDGQIIQLAPKSFETLLVLLESGGRIIGKEELLRKIWPDTFVEEVSLAKKISLLRKVLGEEFAHQYIETFPRRGYRFVVEVREVWEAAPAQLPNRNGEMARSKPGDETSGAERMAAETFLETTGPSNRPRTLIARVGWSSVLLGIGLLAGVVVLEWVFRSASTASKPPLNAVPLTSFQGRETQAAFSPNGKQIAFVWNGSQGDNQDIYVKLIGVETPLRLTSNAAADTKPAWSPDGRYIAFLRHSTDGSAVYLIPVLGGAEHKLADLFPWQVPGDGNSPYFSPDGKSLVIPDKRSAEEPLGLFLLSVETGEKRRLTTAPAGSLGDYYPAFSPDGKSLAFVRAPRWSTDDLYVLMLSGGEPRRLSFDNLTITGLSWTPDSREIMFTSRRGGGARRLWRAAVEGGALERVDTTGNDVFSPTLSLQGNRLAYTQGFDDINIWRIELDARGKIKDQRELIASTFGDHGPDYSPDGKQIVFASGRSGNNGIWVCESDGSKPRLLHSCGPYVTGSPRWSPDGRWIVFDSRSCVAGANGNPDIYLISADGGQPRRLTDDLAEDVVPSWSRDGNWIYFGSTRSGGMEIWKTPVAGGQSVQMTTQGGFEAVESIDGRYLYYTKGRGLAGLWRTPVAGGKEELVTGHHEAGRWRYWRVTAQGIYFATATAAGPLLEFYDFGARQIREVTRLERGAEPYIPGLAVSPDGRSLLYCRVDRSGSDIMMVEDFH
jgi:Tol biopolymer transport system component/DNA-binding winged helix-turn-helix (wHTH) protein